jgi:hypothetical protein
MRSFYLKSLVCMALLLAMRSEHLFAAQESAPVPITFWVTDQSGAAIPHAQMKLIIMPANVPSELETNDNGKLSLSLESGFYRVSVNSLGFSPFTKQIEVRDTKAQIFQLTLDVSRGGGPVVMGCPDPSLQISAPSLHTLLDNSLQIIVPPGQIKALSKTELRAMAHKTVTVHNPHANADENYSGVELIDLLAGLGVPHGKDLHGKALSDYVIATGSDGYRAVLALAEVDPEFHPGEVIVADSMDGKPLDAKTGPFRLVVTEDKRPARSVHSLVSIEVKQAD